MTDRPADPATPGEVNHRHGYFHRRYAEQDDPWGFDTRWYERRKYALTIAALPRSRYRRALEPGCANGALTELLAERCDALVAFDLLDGPVGRARNRLAGREGVEVTTAEFPLWWPPGPGDLVVWSEVAYYLTDRGFEMALEGLEEWLEPGGDLVAVHYRGATDYPRSGDATHRRIAEATFLEGHVSLVDRDFRLDVWRRSP